jgi:predicted lactoylglutathione lyase
MPRQIFVNFAVKDLERSKKFFAGLGFSFNPQFTDENAACMVIEENSIYSMLHTEKFYQTFLDGRSIADPRKSTEVMTCISCASREEVTRWSRRRRPAAARRTARPPTTASCTTTASRTSTATSGKSCT